MNPSETIRSIAAKAISPDVRELLLRLAAELELQHSKQNDSFQIAIGGTDLSLAAYIDKVQRDLETRLDTLDARQQETLAMLATLRTELRRIGGSE